MRFTAIVEYCKDTGLYVGYVPGFVGAHSQGETLDALNRNLKEVVELLLEDGEPISILNLSARNRSRYFNAQNTDSQTSRSGPSAQKIAVSGRAPKRTNDTAMWMEGRRRFPFTKEDIFHRFY